MKDEIELKKEKNKKIMLVILVLLIAALSSFITYKITTSKEPKKAMSENKKVVEDKKINSSNETNKIESNKNNTVENEATKKIESSENNEQKIETNTEEQVVNYFEEKENYIINNKDNRESVSKIKESYKIIYDFLFNEGKINGYTFKELTTKTKLKILKIALSIDNKIDNYFPDYKDKIKDKYTTLKEKAIKEYLEITANICSSNEQLCKTASEDFNKMKESYKFGISVIKEIVINGSEKLKEWWAN